MLTHPTHEALRTLKLDGMAEVFTELLAQDGPAGPKLHIWAPQRTNGKQNFG